MRKKGRKKTRKKEGKESIYDASAGIDNCHLRLTKAPSRNLTLFVAPKFRGVLEDLRAGLHYSGEVHRS
jgi:hypothetical protein